MLQVPGGSISHCEDVTLLEEEIPYYSLTVICTKFSLVMNIGHKQQRTCSATQHGSCPAKCLYSLGQEEDKWSMPH